MYQFLVDFVPFERKPGFSGLYFLWHMQLMETLEETEVLSPKIENLFDDISTLHNNLEVEFISADGNEKSCTINGLHLHGMIFENDRKFS